MPDKIYYKDKERTIELPPEPASIGDLASVIVKCRKAGSIGVSSLSDEAICKSIETAFYLSMRSDEGRFPRLRITSGSENDDRLVIKFKKPVVFSNVHELRRLAPVAESPDFAILFTESQGGKLHCLGLADIGNKGYGSLPGYPGFSAVGGPVSLKIWIEGPGHLFVEEAGNSFEFRAGRVRLVYPALLVISKLRELTLKIGEALHQRAVESVKEISGAEKFFGGHSALSRIITVVLEKILDTCLELRHGGAFVILPGEESTTEAYGINCKYPLEGTDFGEEIVKYWSTHIKVAHCKKERVEKYDKWLRNCNISTAKLLNNIDAVAHLSAADGCVVLTNHLRVLGFGGSILVSEEECKENTTKVKLANGLQCNIDEFLLDAGGQRHQSAAKLILKHNDIIIFVISQDGELSLFVEDKEGYVRVFRAIDPSFSPHSQ